RLVNVTSLSLTFGITPKYAIGYGEELLSSGVRSTPSHSSTAEKAALRIAARFFKNAVVLRFLCRLRLLQFGVRGCLAAACDGQLRCYDSHGFNCRVYVHGRAGLGFVGYRCSCAMGRCWLPCVAFLCLVVVSL